MHKTENGDWFNWVTERIAIGAQIEDEYRLFSEGISHVINVADGGSKDSYILAHQKHMQLLDIPIADDDEDGPLDYWRSLVSFATEKLKLPEAKLYVHCGLGVSRSAGAVYAILRATGLEQQECIDLIKMKRYSTPEKWHDRADTALRQLGYI